MADIPTTSTTLLRDLAQDSQHARWGEFVARYRPMMEAFMREHFPSLDADNMWGQALRNHCKISLCARTVAFERFAHRY